MTRRDKITQFVAHHRTCTRVRAPEGEFVVVFNPEVAELIARPFTTATVRHIGTRFAPIMHITLTSTGYAQAADRVGGGTQDVTHYDAVWVRDSAWVYHALAEIRERAHDARTLILALWDYYATDAQRLRFDEIIGHPQRASDKMKVPHVRFDGRAPDLGDVLVDGIPQVWNHRQNDAHGLFLVALADAAIRGLVKVHDLTAARAAVLARFPSYFAAINFETFEDAGAWEEIDRRNTSSIALVTRGLQSWTTLLYEPPWGTGDFAARFHTLMGAEEASLARWWQESHLRLLSARGLAAVRQQLHAGGESPGYDPSDLRFRRADAALLFLLTPEPLAGLCESEMRRILDIVGTLQRPAGILRYEGDSYQSGNFWLRTATNRSYGRQRTPTDDASTIAGFKRRHAHFIPHTEAQWFFDSLLAQARLHLAAITGTEGMRQNDIHRAALHLKRALGQLTGNLSDAPLIAADGTAIAPDILPESINTILVSGKRYLLPSPIAPLNWSKAALSMALTRFARIACDDTIAYGPLS